MDANPYNFPNYFPKGVQTKHNSDSKKQFAQYADCYNSYGQYYDSNFPPSAYQGSSMNFTMSASPGIGLNPINPNNKSTYRNVPKFGSAQPESKTSQKRHWS